VLADLVVIATLYASYGNTKSNSFMPTKYVIPYGTVHVAVPASPPTGVTLSA
jgi:hypothetical protein